VLLTAVDCSSIREVGEKLGSYARLKKELTLAPDLNEAVKLLIDINKETTFARALARRIKRQRAMLIRGE
jgi:hypothetical protein